MTFTDTGILTIENHPFRRGDEEFCLYIRAEYEVECNCVSHSHDCPMGEDYPDGEECDCIYVDLVDCYPCDDGGEEIPGFSLSSQERKRLLAELAELAESDYCENGSWGK